MAKLYFRYGVVGSSKSTCMLTVGHNYKQQNKKAILVKPKIDTRSADIIYSRTGLSAKADILLDEKTDLLFIISEMKDVNAILVDEVQFANQNHINHLRHITTLFNIPCICYGLRTNYQGELFEGSRALLAVADKIEEIKNTCWFCDKKAIMNLKYIDGKATSEGRGEPEMGFEDKYLPACYKHYMSELGKG